MNNLNSQGGNAARITYGNKDNKVSPYLKAWVAQMDSQSNIRRCVVGVIAPGTSRMIQANWSSPFEQSNLGNIFDKAAALTQMKTGETSITKFSSTQIWEGNRPHSFNLVLLFYAISDALKEVMEPLRELEKMMGYEENAIMPGGRIPGAVEINIGRNMLVKDCVIESMSVPLDGERTKDGYLVRAEATLNISTKVMLNKNDIGTTWPQS